MIDIDIVTVFHNEVTHEQHMLLQIQIATWEENGGYRFIAVDNTTTNRGFARACNLGASHPDADAPIIGFINPDAKVTGPFINIVRQALTGPVVITGSRFGKPDRELKAWGVHDWVCGAAFFVKRDWFQAVGGFDEQYVWSHEETDLIRQAQAQGRQVRSISLPIEHTSPDENSAEDVAYKNFHFNQAQRRFYRKWPPRRT